MKYKVGMVLGRFQPIHNGHLSIIQRALEDCEKVILIVGSAQESGTEQNPLSLLDRTQLIIRSLRGNMKRIEIFPIADREDIAADASWGEYVLETLEKAGIDKPEAVYVGGGEHREDWYTSVGLDVVITDRNITPISSTQIRTAIKEDNYDFFCEAMHPNTWRLFNSLKKILLETKVPLYEIEVCINGKKEIYTHEATEEFPIEVFIIEFMEKHIGEDISMFKVVKKGR